MESKMTVEERLCWGLGGLGWQQLMGEERERTALHTKVILANDYCYPALIEAKSGPKS